MTKKKERGKYEGIEVWKREKLWNMNAPHRDGKKKETKHMSWKLFECWDRICRLNIQVKFPSKIYSYCALNRSFFFVNMTFFIALIWSVYAWNTGRQCVCDETWINSLTLLQNCHPRSGISGPHADIRVAADILCLRPQNDAAATYQ